MLDLKFIRENPEKVRQGIRNKNEGDKLDDLLKLDEERRDLILKTDELKHKRNSVSSKIPQMKKAGQDVTNILGDLMGGATNPTQAPDLASILGGLLGGSSGSQSSDIETLVTSLLGGQTSSQRGRPNRRSR